MSDSNPTTESPMSQLFGDVSPALRTLAMIREHMQSEPWNTPPEKLQRAYEACLAGRVQWDPSANQWVVLSKERKGVSYAISQDGRCPCDNAVKRYGGAPNSCTHAVAAAMQQRFLRECDQEWSTEGKMAAQLIQGVTEQYDEETGELLHPFPSPPPNDHKASQHGNGQGMTDQTIQADTETSVSAMSRLPLIPRRIAYRPLTAIVADLNTPLPDDCIAHRKQGGVDIAYLHWWDAETLLDTYAPGWEGQIVSIQHYPGVTWECLTFHEQHQYTKAVEEYTKAVEASTKAGERGKKPYPPREVLLPIRMIGRVAIHYRLTIPHADGTTTRDDIGNEDDSAYGYGDPFSNAKAMALCRAAAQFGVRWLYEDKGDEATSTALQKHLRAQTRGLWGKVRMLVETKGADRDEVLEWLLRTSGTTQREEVCLSALQQMAAWLSRGEPLGDLLEEGERLP